MRYGFHANTLKRHDYCRKPCNLANLESAHIRISHPWHEYEQSLPLAVSHYTTQPFEG